VILKVDAAKMNIRDFSIEDWNDVARIYKEGLDTGIASFETEVPPFEVWDHKFHKACRLVALSSTIPRISCLDNAKQVSKKTKK